MQPSLGGNIDLCRSPHCTGSLCACGAQGAQSVLPARGALAIHVRVNDVLDQWRERQERYLLKKNQRQALSAWGRRALCNHRQSFE